MTVADLKLLETLFPSENGLTVFDADTQETSYGVCFVAGAPHIFDTHKKDGFHVATIELLTEVVSPIRVAPDQVDRFCREARRLGLLPIPYTGCFFKGNLHVYAFAGPLRGFDLAAVGATVPESEQRLQDRVEELDDRVPPAIARAQHELLRARRSVRHGADLEVLLRRSAEVVKSEDRDLAKRRTL